MVKKGFDRRHKTPDTKRPFTIGDHATSPPACKAAVAKLNIGSYCANNPGVMFTLNTFAA
jgi:hypothetical protein